MSLERMQKYRKTKKGLICVIYNNEKIRSKNKGWPAPEYDLITLRRWLLSQDTFHILYDQWVDSGYDLDLKPSIDRLDNYKPYSLDNIQIVTWKDNNERGTNDQVIGINTKNCDAVMQLDREGNIIKEFHSIRSAGRETGIDSGNINLVCNGKRLTAGGYKWKKVN